MKESAKHVGSLVSRSLIFVSTTWLGLFFFYPHEPLPNRVCRGRHTNLVPKFATNSLTRSFACLERCHYSFPLSIVASTTPRSFFCFRPRPLGSLFALTCVCLILMVFLCTLCSNSDSLSARRRIKFIVAIIRRTPVQATTTTTTTTTIIIIIIIIIITAIKSRVSNNVF